jgi:hypothetical protein
MVIVLVRPLGGAVSAVSKRDETDKILIFRDKALSVSLFHSSGG